MKSYDTFRSNRISPWDIEQQPPISSSFNNPSIHEPPSFKDLTFSEKFKFIRKKTIALIWEYFILSLIILFGFITLIFYLTKHSLLKSGKIVTAKVFDLLLYEFLLTTVSIFMYKRITMISMPKKIKQPWLKYIRIGLIILTLIFIFLTHLSYLFYYISLPDEFVIPTICFFAFGIWIHFGIFLGIVFIIECIDYLAIALISRFCRSISYQNYALKFFKFPLFKSKTLHTLFTLLLALILTIQGHVATDLRPNVKNLNISIRDLPPEFNGYSIALITDIHTGPTVGKGKNEEIVKIVNSLQPDIITIVGDLTDGYLGYIGSRSLPLKDLKAKDGKFATMGNHEYFYENPDNWIDFYRTQLNLTTFINEGKILRKDGKQICLAGLDDYYVETAKVKGHKMDIEKALSLCPPDIPTIVLAHQPNGAAKVLTDFPKTGKRVDLILAGHTHAGQFFVIYPFTYFTIKYLFGHYIYKATNTQIYVSSGVNYWGPPVKMLHSMCEIVNVKLYRDPLSSTNKIY